MGPINFVKDSIRRYSDKPLVLLVPDSKFWVTGRIAAAIAKNSCEYNFILCSAPVLRELLLKHKGDLPFDVNVVHFLTPHIAKEFKGYFYERCALVSVIHHIENIDSIEPIDYSDAIMTVSKQWHKELLSLCSDETAIVMIQNGIDVDLFRPPTISEREKVRNKFKLNSDDYVIGFSAKKTSDTCGRKGIDILENLFKKTAEQKKSKIVWFIRGPGWNDFVEEMRKKGVRICYCPFLVGDDELAESYRALDAFVVTSRIEGGPVPLLEAMSSGLPVVSTKVGVASEIINDSDNGFLVDFDSPDQMMQKIEIISRDKRLAKSIGIEARRTIVDKLQWRNTTKNINELYSIANRNFYKRKHSNREELALKAGSYQCYYKYKRWIDSREHAFFVNFLIEQEAFGAAKKIANKTILYSINDADVLLRVINYSSLSALYGFYVRIRHLSGMPDNE